jgi:hypothetical protein
MWQLALREHATRRLETNLPWRQVHGRNPMHLRQLSKRDQAGKGRGAALICALQAA